MGISKLYALLVAINDYQEPIPPLKGCVNDLKKVDLFLKGYEDQLALHIQHLQNSAATKTAIVEAFGHHLMQASSDDVVFFYFSGHGTQEEADSLFWPAEPDRKLEALVCYDSYSKQDGQVRYNLLADKELRFLIKKLASKGAHILSVFDCCHAGGNTRNGYITDHQSVSERRYVHTSRLSRAFPMRQWDDFVFSGEISNQQAKGQDLDDWLPEGPHIQMAACQDDQSAYEANGEGIFTKHLIDVLNRCDGKTTYFDLQNRIQNFIKNQFDQTPKIYAAGGDESLLFRNFLGGAEGNKPLYGNINFNSSHGWIMDLGAMHGVPPPTTAIRVLTYDEKTEFEATVNKVYPGYTTISFKESDPPGIDKEANLKGYFPNYLSIPMSLYLEKDVPKQEVIKASLENQMNLSVAQERYQADYCLDHLDQQILITRPSMKNVPVVPAQPFNSEDDLSVIGNYLSHIGQFEFVKNLHNPNAFLFPNEPLSITVYHIDPLGQERPLSIKEGVLWFNSSDTESPLSTYRIRIKLQNRFDQKLYVALLYLSFNFGVNVNLLKGVTAGLEPGKEVWALERAGIGLTIEPEINTFNYPESTTYLKLIISTEDFKDQVTRFELPDLPSPVIDVRGLTKGLAVDGYNPGAITDWTTRLYTLKIKNPNYQ